MMNLATFYGHIKVKNCLRFESAIGLQIGLNFDSSEVKIESNWIVRNFSISTAEGGMTGWDILGCHTHGTGLVVIHESKKMFRYRKLEF